MIAVLILVLLGSLSIWGQEAPVIYASEQVGESQVLFRLGRGEVSEVVLMVRKSQRGVLPTVWDKRTHRVTLRQTKRPHSYLVDGLTQPSAITFNGSDHARLVIGHDVIEVQREQIAAKQEELEIGSK